MGRLLLVVALAGAAVADDALVRCWDSPQRESFDVKAAVTEQLVEELRTRYGVRFSFPASDTKLHDFAAKDVTFFEALDRLAALHGLVLTGAPVKATGDYGEPKPLALVRPAEGVRPIPAVFVGPSRLSVQSVSLVVTAHCAPEEEEDDGHLVLGGFGQEDVPGLGVRLRWIVEPGFEGIGHFDLKVVAAEDDTGQPIEVGSEPSFDLEWVRPANRDFVLRLGRPSAKAKAIRKLEGTMRVAIPVEWAKIEFLADEVGKAKELGGAKVTLDSIDPEKKAVAITLSGTPCAGLGESGYPDLLVGSDDHVWRGSWAGSAIKVLPYDAGGRGIQQGSEGTNTTRGDDKWTAKVALEAVPARIAIEALVRAAVREATFSFADIPLPE